MLLAVLKEFIIRDKISCDMQVPEHNKSVFELIKEANPHFAKEMRDFEEHKHIHRYRREANSRPNFFNRKDPQALIRKEGENRVIDSATIGIKFKG